jgi:hypothetical protein
MVFDIVYIHICQPRLLTSSKNNAASRRRLRESRRVSSFSNSKVNGQNHLGLLKEKDLQRKVV